MSKYEHREREENFEKHKEYSTKENHTRLNKEINSHKSHKRSRDKEVRSKRRSCDRETQKRNTKDNYEHSSGSRHNKHDSSGSKESKRRRNKSPIPPRATDNDTEKEYGIKIPIKQEKDFDKRRSELSMNRKHGNTKSEFDFSIVKKEHDQGNKHEQFSGQKRKEHNERLEEAFKGTSSNSNQSTEPIEKEKSNLGLSGALTEDTNTYKGVVIKYNKPPEARIPKKKWRLYPFKDNEALKVLHLHRQSAYLIGRQRRIVDIAVDHPSCSKQHAVFQFRCVEEEKDGRLRRLIKPYIIDLGAANGTFLNNQQIEPQRYYEMKEQDMLKFGFSSREYVLLHDKSDTTEQAEKQEDSETE